MNELTDKQREALTTRFLDLRTQAKDVWLELVALHEEFCLHEYVELSPETSQCRYCHKVCSHNRAATLTKECADCGSTLIIEIEAWHKFQRESDGR